MSDIKISGGAFTGSHVGDNIQSMSVGDGATVGTMTQNQTIAPVTNVNAVEIDKQLDALRAAVEQLAKQLPPKEAANVKEDFKELEKQAKAEEPRQKWFEVSAEGLLGAAKAVAGMMDPISTSVLALTKLLFP